MQTRLSIAIFLCLAVAPLWAADNPQLAPSQQEVIKVHQVMTEAARKRDFAAWSRYVADDCIFSDDEGELTTKMQIVEQMRNLPLVYDRSENHRDFLVHVYGNAAVLNFRLTAHELFRDSDIITEMRHTQTFVKKEGQWLLIAEQWGALPINFRKPVIADVSNYKDYVGEYEWREGGPVDRVWLKDGKLLARMTGESQDHEYKPLGSGTFFLEDDLGSVTFVRDAQGHVSGYTYQRADGQEVHAKKVK